MSPAPAIEKTPPVPEVSELDLFNLETGLKTRVVTASGGIEEERDIASANVFVVQRQAIVAHGWRSLAEVLANVPGLYIIDDQVLPTLGVRGVTGGLRAGTRVVKVMIDGQPVHFRPMLSAFLGPEYIPMEAVERVEVAKGPLSALYGANAFIATVNVITRKGAPNLTAELGARLTVFKSPGVGGSALISYEGKNRGVLFAFSIDELQRNGLALQTTFPGQDPLSGLFDRPSADDVAVPISALARFHVGSERLGIFTLQGGVQRLDSTGQFQLNSVLTDQTRIAILNLWTNARYEKNWKKADSFYEIAAGLTTKPAGVLNNWVFSKLTRGDNAGAEKLFTEALKYDPALFTAKNNLVLARAGQRKYDLPVVEMTQPERAELLYTMALAAIKQGDVSVGKGLLQQAIDTHPQHFEAAARALAALDSNVTG